jgi:tRNA nucleotidyltransferase (CCA-adding enzyme)
MTDLYWHIIATHITPSSLPDVCHRLVFGKTMSESIKSIAGLMDQVDILEDPSVPPSRIVEILEGVPDIALLAVWIAYGNLFVQNRIQQYATEWRHIRPKTDGHRLRAMGLPPGPCYRRLLSRLRMARLDGEVTDEAGELQLLDRLLGEGFCDDGA